MHLTGDHTFDAPIQSVWDTLLDPDIIAACMPGKEKFEQIGPDYFEAAMRIKVGPINGSAVGRVRLAEQEPPRRYRMIVEGKGGIGNATGSGVLTLSEQAGKTVVAYDGDVQVTGRVASVGQRLMGMTAKVMINQFFKCMEDKVPRSE